VVDGKFIRNWVVFTVFGQSLEVHNKTFVDIFLLHFEHILLLGLLFWWPEVDGRILYFINIQWFLSEIKLNLLLGDLTLFAV
jgi:hypothetical protein